MTGDRPDLLVANGRVVNETGIVEADIAVADGRVVALGDLSGLPAARETVDAAGRYVLPGAIDVHVHFREPGMEEKETWATGSMAAAVGGVTTVFEMPNTIPPTDTPDRLAHKRGLAEAKSIVDFGLYGLLGEQNLDQLEALAEAGAIGFKLFLGNTTGNLPCPGDGAVLEGLEILAELGRRCTVHAENSPILFWRQQKMEAAGRMDPLAHLAARADVVAAEALNRICVLADWTGARIHIAHESCAYCLPYIRFHKSRGVDVTVETLPQYLYLDAEMMLSPGGEVLRMNPPIRQKTNQGPLWEALLDGTVDMIATDHAPHLPAEKYGNRIWDVACGFPGVETSMPLMLTAVNAGRMSLEHYVKVSSAAPARAFGLYGRKGVLRPGADADLVLVEMAGRDRLAADRLHSRGKTSPYEGMEVVGRPVMTLVRGKVVARDGEPVAEPGWGRQVDQQMPAAQPRNTSTTTKAILDHDRRPWD